ncbi:actin-binding ADF family protein [Streptomyces sp. NPDC057287]|uniref:actin-binding ADF family protein n=1 Tax=Streptomyces sp. NPDC057287 TaxID=3346086 RepID=UPI0036263600
MRTFHAAAPRCRGSSVQHLLDGAGRLPETKCHWPVYDFEFEKAGAGIRNKLTFVSWAPDTAKIKQKMLFAASKEALRKALVGIAVEIQGTEYNEVSYESLLDKANRRELTRHPDQHTHTWRACGTPSARQGDPPHDHHFHHPAPAQERPPFR